MLLEFANFRCYEGTHRVKFEQGAVTLLSGKSGAGKTTLMRAVEWCLFGTRGLLTTAQSIDEVQDVAAPKRRDDAAPERRDAAVPKRRDAGASTWVKLTWGAHERSDNLPLVVHRLRGNNKLYVKHGDLELSGETAQNLVVRIFGSLTLWRSSAYIAQKERCELTQLSGKRELLAALNEMAFQGGGGFGVCNDDLQCLTPEAVKARIEAYARDCEKRLVSLTNALRFEEGTLDQFLRTHRSVLDALEAGMSQAYDPKQHDEALERVEQVRRAASLSEALREEIASLRAALASLPGEDSMSGDVKTLDALCARARDMSKIEERISGLEREREKVREWLSRNGSPADTPPAPPVAPRLLVDEFGECSSYPDALDKPAPPRLHQVSEEDIRYAENYESGALWFKTHFPDFEYSSTGVAGAVGMLEREIARRELYAFIEQHDVNEMANSLASMRERLAEIQKCENERANARQRVEMFARKYPVKWLELADTFNDEALIEVARQVLETRASRVSTKEPQDPRVTRNEAMRRAFASTSEEMRRLDAQTLDDLLQMQAFNEQCLAASKISSRVRAHQDALERVEYATPSLHAELVAQLDALQTSVEEAKLKLDFSDPMKCPCCGEDVVLASGKLVPSDGMTRDQRQAEIAAKISTLQSEIEKTRSHAQQCKRDMEERERITRALEAERAELGAFDERVLLEVESARKNPEAALETWNSQIATIKRVYAAADTFRNFFGTPAHARLSEEEYITRRELWSLPATQLEWICSVPEIRAARAELAAAERQLTQLGNAKMLRDKYVELENAKARYESARKKLEELGDFMLATYPLDEDGLGALHALRKELAALWVPSRGAPRRSVAEMRALLNEDQLARQAYEAAVQHVHALEVAAKKYNLDLARYGAAIQLHEERVRHAQLGLDLDDKIALEKEQLDAVRSEIRDYFLKLGLVQVPQDAQGVIARCEMLRNDLVAKLAKRKHLEETLASVEARFANLPEDVRDDAASALARAERELSEHASRRAWSDIRDEFESLRARIKSKRDESCHLEVEIEHAKEIKRHAEALETRMLEQVIEDLNTSLSEICPKLFEAGASVYITLTKQNASNDALRTAFEVHLVQNGKDITLSGISGGEGDRVSFALTLALADLSAFYASPFIMLDECMGSLDQELREQCIEAIKDYARRRPHKTIIVVDHLTLSGLFDEVKVVDGGEIFRLVNGILEPETGH